MSLGAVSFAPVSITTATTAASPECRGQRRHWGLAGTRAAAGIGDRGSATVELAVLFPAFLALVFGGVQAAEWYHVRNLCLAAADSGVQAGRTTGATDAQARHAAAAFLTRAGAGTVAAPAVSTAGSSTALVRVEVSASVPRVLPLPGLSLRVTQSARSAREVFTTDTRGIRGAGP